MSCSKKLKHCENDQQQMDYIGNLPDTLLCHILSFVPTKSAVATSILSRRWVSLWTKVPVLDFTDITILILLRDSEDRRLNSFMNKVLLQNDLHHLQRVQFEIFQGSEIFWLNVLNNSLLKREIREINITKQWGGRYNVPMQLPTALYSRERLVVLKLRGTFNISLPFSVHLPRLETLSLHGIYFEGQDTLKIVASSCPALKELVIEYCEGIRKLYVESLTLERLRIQHIREEMVVVKGPKLTILDVDCLGAEHDFNDLSSLVEARVDVHADEATKLPPALKPIRRFSHVRTLQLSQSAVDVFGRVSENELPMFPNLTLLHIVVSHSMFQTLKFAPRIMRLIVNVGRTIAGNETRSFPSDIVPHCLLSLPCIEIQNFGGFDEDSALVKYIFKNAIVLKELKIHMHRASVKRERDAYKKLLCFPRLSPCDVIICSSCGDNPL